MITPTLDLERELLAAGACTVAGMDEVGRGALAGPVSVGVVVVDRSTPDPPSKVADSKLLTPVARLALAPQLRAWAKAHAVGHASAAEIDTFGIIAALRLAGQRALVELSRTMSIDVVVLDGAHDWLSPHLFEPFEVPQPMLEPFPLVRTGVKADRNCAAVAAASVLAKTERDAIMADLATSMPEYGWERNKGYGAAQHMAAIRDIGLTQYHRRSWNLQG